MSARDQAMGQKAGEFFTRGVMRMMTVTMRAEWPWSSAGLMVTTLLPC